MAISIEEILRQIPPETEDMVNRALKEFRPRIQEILRDESRLYLRRPRDNGNQDAAKSSTQVPVHVKEGLPEVLQDFKLPPDIDPIVILIASFRVHLERASKGLHGLEPLIHKLARDPRGEDLLAGREHNIPPVRELLAQLLHQIRDIDLGRLILGVNEDVLGAYIFRLPSPSIFEEPGRGSRIELYWAVIGLFAYQLDISVEDLTVVVLAHEFAHAYTHRGIDIAGFTWDDEAFAKSDKRLKEGLAQYYTHVIASHLDRFRPGIFKAYESLLEKQPPDYHAHLPWVNACDKEALRNTMVEERRQRIGSLDHFNDAIGKANDRLGKRTKM